MGVGVGVGVGVVDVADEVENPDRVLQTSIYNHMKADATHCPTDLANFQRHNARQVYVYSTMHTLW